MSDTVSLRSLPITSPHWELDNQLAQSIVIINSLTGMQIACHNWSSAQCYVLATHTGMTQNMVSAPRLQNSARTLFRELDTLIGWMACWLLALLRSIILPL